MALKDLTPDETVTWLKGLRGRNLRIKKRLSKAIAPHVGYQSLDEDIGNEQVEAILNKLTGVRHDIGQMTDPQVLAEFEQVNKKLDETKPGWRKERDIERREPPEEDGPSKLYRYDELPDEELLTAECLDERYNLKQSYLSKHKSSLPGRRKYGNKYIYLFREVVLLAEEKASGME